MELKRIAAALEAKRLPAAEEEEGGMKTTSVVLLPIIPIVIVIHRVHKTVGIRIHMVPPKRRGI